MSHPSLRLLIMLKPHVFVFFTCSIDGRLGPLCVKGLKLVHKRSWNSLIMTSSILAPNKDSSLFHFIRTLYFVRFLVLLFSYTIFLISLLISLENNVFMYYFILLYNECLFTCSWSLNLLLSVKLPPVDIFILARDIMQKSICFYTEQKRTMPLNMIKQLRKWYF